MCGRSRQTVEPQALASAVGFDSNVRLRRADHYRPRENAHPGNASPVAYTTASGNNALRTMRWGLVPSFTKKGDKPNFFRMFNARSETAAEKPSFRRLVSRRRGVVAFSGFYEWKTDDKGEKQPYYFHFQDDRPMLLATLYDTWEKGDGGGSASGWTDTHDHGERGRDGEGGVSSRTREEEEEEDKEDKSGKVMFSYAVLTTSSSPRMQWLHERMPVMLGQEEAKKWLKYDDTDAPTALRNLPSYNEQDLVWHPVSKQMNNMGYSEPDCSAAVKLEPNKPLPAITSFFKKAPASVTSTSSLQPTTEQGKPSRAVSIHTIREGGTDVASTTSVKTDTQANGTCGSGSSGKAKNDDEIARGREKETLASAGEREGGHAAPLDLSREEDGNMSLRVKIAMATAGVDSKSLSPSSGKRATGRGPGSAIPKSPIGKKRAMPTKVKGGSPASRDKKQPRLTSFFHVK